jgi:predicted RNA-binding protein with TRAM domain
MGFSGQEVPSKGRLIRMTQFPFAKQKVTGLAEGEIIKVRIEDVGKQGDGIARVQGLVIFVAGAKPGDEVDVKVVRLGKNCAFAEKV